MPTQPIITPQSTFDAVILCDGDYPSHPTPLCILNHATHLICCDGAGMKHIQAGGKPEAIIGDGDSLPDAFKQTHADIIHIVDEQEDNDQTKATRYCMAKGYKRIAYIGSTGKREDHTLGNIFLLSRYMSQYQLDVTMVTDHGYFTPACGTQVFDTFPRQQISIFNISCRQLCGTGFRWEPYTYQELWRGTLNEAKGHSVTIHADGIYIIFRTFEAKE